MPPADGSMRPDPLWAKRKAFAPLAIENKQGILQFRVDDARTGLMALLEVDEHRDQIEVRLSLGLTGPVAMRPHLQEALRRIQCRAFFINLAAVHDETGSRQRIDHFIGHQHPLPCMLRRGIQPNTACKQFR